MFSFLLHLFYIKRLYSCLSILSCQCFWFMFDLKSNNRHHCSWWPCWRYDSRQTISDTSLCTFVAFESVDAAHKSFSFKISINAKFLMKNMEKACFCSFLKKKQENISKSFKINKIWKNQAIYLILQWIIEKWMKKH